MAEKSGGRTMSRQEVEQKIVALAWKDEAFRKAFLADPKKQFEETLGRKLPPGLKMSAHAEDENHLYFVIPAKPADSGEISDADLETVAGGVDLITGTIAASIATTALIATAVATNVDNANKAKGKESWG